MTELSHHNGPCDGATLQGDDMDITRMTRAVVRAVRRGGRRTAIERGRKAALALGITPNPVGAGNVKTDLPSTYRPVGPTCPVDCRYLGAGCYAQGGNVAIHQRRASPELLPSLASAAIAMASAAVEGSPCRLHVSGGFARHGAVDAAYVYGLCEVADAVRRTFKATTVAWSYTHFDATAFEPYRLMMAVHGIEVLYSDAPVAGGAVVWPHADVSALRETHPGVTFAKCPAQLSDYVTCFTCNVCAEARTKSVAVVFDPHGSRAKAATRASRAA